MVRLHDFVFESRLTSCHRLECEPHVIGYSCAVYKSHATAEKGRDWIAEERRLRHLDDCDPPAPVELEVDEELEETRRKSQELSGDSHDPFISG